MDVEIPQARGFAAALERHLANGGGLRKSGSDRVAGAVFTKGKARGLTVEGATQQARDMWDKAPASVKEKYSRRGGEGLLAPSERRMAATLQRPASRQSALDGGSLDPVQAARNSVDPAAAPRTRAGNESFIRAEVGLPPAATKAPSQNFGASAMIPDKARGAVGTDRPVNPGLVAPSRSSAIAKGAVSRPEAGVAPSRSQAIAAGAVQRPALAAGAKRINPLTGKPMGWHPSDDAPAASKTTGYAGPSAGRFDPDLGFVPTATPVSEAPLDQAGYDKLGRDIKDTLDPSSPETSAALGRRRTFEDQQMAANAAVERRKRVGPSIAERDETDRKARRALDRRVAASYGAVS
jgi:hypothetical protein